MFFPSSSSSFFIFLFFLTVNGLNANLIHFSSEKQLDLIPLIPDPWRFDQNNLWRLPGAHGEEVVRSVYLHEQVHIQPHPTPFSTRPLTHISPRPSLQAGKTASSALGNQRTVQRRRARVRVRLRRLELRRRVRVRSGLSRISWIFMYKTSELLVCFLTSFSVVNMAPSIMTIVLRRSSLFALVVSNNGRQVAAIHRSPAATIKLRVTILHHSARISVRSDV